MLFRRRQKLEESLAETLLDCDDLMEAHESGLANLGGHIVAVGTSAEAERSGFRNIRDESEAWTAVRQLVEYAYLAAKDHYDQQLNDENPPPEQRD